MGQKRLIIVAGMHRSGTSAYTGAIENLGVKLGRNLAPGHAGINDKGYKEDIDIIELHEDLLWAHSSAWNDIFPVELNEIDPTVFAGAHLKIKELLNEYFSDSDLCGLKDPRVCLFLPLWLEVASELGVEVSFVIPFRNPYAVSASLEKRDGLSLDTSLILWAKYLLYAEKYSRGYKRIFVSYEALIDDPVGALGEIVDQLNVPLKGDAESLLEKGAGFISAGLNRSKSSVETQSIGMQSFPVLLFDILKTADQTELSKKQIDEISQIWQHYQTYVSELDPILKEQVEIFKGYAVTHRGYWLDALGSRSVKIGQAMKKILGFKG